MLSQRSADHAPASCCFGLILLHVAMIFVSGCGGPTQDITVLQREMTKLEKKNRELGEALAGSEKKVEALQRQNENMQVLGGDRLAKLYHTARIEIGRYSSGADTDGQWGDDGLVLYLKLYDQDGHEFKAAGEIDVCAYDMSEPDQPKLVADRHYDMDQAKTQWFGRLLTYHYKIECPWKMEVPSASSLTVIATFVDGLTGSVLQATRQIEIRRPVLSGASP